jgi:hypothetical protein
MNAVSRLDAASTAKLLVKTGGRWSSSLDRNQRDAGATPDGEVTMSATLTASETFNEAQMTPPLTPPRRTELPIAIGRPYLPRKIQP